MDVVWAPPSPDPRAIVAASEALGISEFDFFRLAFKRWSGREPDESTLERTFVAYMFEQKAPHWARHLSREILRRRHDGTLDPAAFDISGLRRRPPLPRLGRFSWSIVALTLLIVFLMSLETTYIKDRSIPPGCPGSSGSIFLDRFAGWIFKPTAAVCPPFTYPGRRKMFTPK